MAAKVLVSNRSNQFSEARLRWPRKNLDLNEWYVGESLYYAALVAVIVILVYLLDSSLTGRHYRNVVP